MKVLVLGGAGLIGSHIVRALLHSKFEVRVLLRKQSDTRALEGLKIERVLGDLEDPSSLTKALKGCEALFHAAGYYPVYSLCPEPQKKRALRQMKNVLEAAGKTGTLKKIIYTSSMSTIGIPKSGMADETTPYHPAKHRGLYYEIKYLMEQKALGAAKAGLPLTVVNPTGVFGDYDVKPTSGIFILRMAKGRIPFIFEAKFNAVDARDVAQGQVAALKKGSMGERYILGGENTTIWDFSHRIARLAGVKPPSIKLPLFLGGPFARVSELLGKYLIKLDKPFFSQVGMDFIRNGTHFDCSKAVRELQFPHTPLEETIQRALNWFRKNHYLRES